MFETTSLGRLTPETTLHDRIGSAADFVRWEYRPGDRYTVLASIAQSRIRSGRRRIAWWRLRRPGKVAQVEARRPHSVRRPLRAVILETERAPLP